MMRWILPAQLKRTFTLVPLLAALLALAPHFALAQPRHSGHAPIHVHRKHVAVRHRLLAAATHPLHTQAKSLKAHGATAPHIRYAGTPTHHHSHVILHARSRHDLDRQTDQPVARNLAPNAPPMVFGSTITSSLLYTLTTYRLQVCLLRPSLGRAPPVLL